MNREPRVRDVRQRQVVRPAAPESCWEHDEEIGRSNRAADGAQAALAGRGLMKAPGSASGGAGPSARVARHAGPAHRL